MNRVQVEIGANVQGFVDGMNQADQAVKQYETDQKKIRDSLGNFKKEFAQAKREVINLASAYSKLDAAAKASAFGKEMAKQLEEAKIKAAEMVDMQGDLNQELKNMASDTRALDTLAEGMGVVGNVTSATLGIVAQFTGNEKDAQRAIVAFTTAQSVLSTVTSIANALQKQSNTMLAINKVQTLAATAATNMKTAAEGKGVLTTKAATVAQAAFNKVAMANPYVLLATAILTVVGALTAFIAFTHKSEAAEKAEAKAAEEAKSIKDAYYNAYNQKLTETMGNYTKLQQEWKNLKSEGEKNQWIKDNENAFHELGYSINNTAEAEKFFVDNEQAVIDSFNARALAAAYAAQQVEVFNQALNGTPKAGEKLSVKEAAKYGIDTKGHEVESNWFDDNTITLTKEDEKKIREVRLKEASKTNEELGKERLDAEKKASEAAAKTGAKVYNKTREKELKKGANSSKIKTDVEVKIEKDSLAESEKKLKKLEELRTKMSINNPDLPKIKKEIEDTKKEIENKKIKLGIEVEPSELDKLETDLKEKELLLRADISQEEKDKIYQEILELRDKIQREKIAAHIIIDPQIEIDNKARQAVQDVVNSINVQEKPKWNFNNIAEVDPGQAKMLDRLVAQYNLVYDARERLMQLMNDENASDTQIAEAQKALEEMGPLYDGILDKLNSFKDVDDAVGDSIKKMKKLQHTVSQVGEAIQSCADLFSALGEAGNDTSLNIAGIVAKAVATVALSYAQALTTAKTWVDWLAFGISGLATMTSMISSIKSATNGYAQGGIVGGSSYSGDNLYARVNSGEMILNKRQQSNLFDMINDGVSNNRGMVVSEVKIKGSDLYLALKNYGSTRQVLGKNIGIK